LWISGVVDIFKAIKKGLNKPFIFYQFLINSNLHKIVKYQQLSPFL
jgi:hypothetical protein